MSTNILVDIQTSKNSCRLRHYYKRTKMHQQENIFNLADSLLRAGCQRELFLSEVNNRETIAAIKANNDTYCIQKEIEKFPLK